MCDVQQLADYWTSTVNCSSPLIKGRLNRNNRKILLTLINVHKQKRLNLVYVGFKFKFKILPVSRQSWQIVIRGSD